MSYTPQPSVKGSLNWLLNLVSDFLISLLKGAFFLSPVDIGETTVAVSSGARDGMAGITANEIEGVSSASNSVLSLFCLLNLRMHQQICLELQSMHQGPGLW
ncbi:hypothetical protein Nepgr_028029 [Nepenthes gracilis]|uniref:Uncharacterized protein n=1 Tax=Nepenthes gracilis TaxID=150966 RepID=A0AAD3TBM7_NEPGR|nr:hypothetical protein Nepgr_028029 [Nepenthes gracilis]